MADNKIKMIVMGNLGRDAEVRHTPNGRTVMNTSICANERWTDANGQTQERENWVKVEIWGERGVNLAPHLTAGKFMSFEGRPTAQAYEHEGKPRASLVLTVGPRDEILFLSNGRTVAEPQEESEIPF